MTPNGTGVTQYHLALESVAGYDIGVSQTTVSKSYKTTPASYAISNMVTVLGNPIVQGNVRRMKASSSNSSCSHTTFLRLYYLVKQPTKLASPRKPWPKPLACWLSSLSLALSLFICAPEALDSATMQGSVRSMGTRNRRDSFMSNFGLPGAEGRKRRDSVMSTGNGEDSIRRVHLSWEEIVQHTKNEAPLEQQIPDASSHLKDGELEKLCTDNLWQVRWPPLPPPLIVGTF